MGKKSSSLHFLEKLSGRALSIGGLIESIRKGEELSQVEFAGLLGISPSHLCDIEKGRKLVSVERAALFADLLGRSQEQFVRLSLQQSLDSAGLAFTVRIDSS